MRQIRPPLATRAARRIRRGGRTRRCPGLKPGGHLVSLVGPPSRTLADRAGVSATGILVRSSGAQLTDLTALFERGRLQGGETTAMPLAEVRAAHEAIASKHTRGKIVLVP